jgi:hypothetical protein
VRECENKRREKELALGCPCGCVTRLWMLAGVGERERDGGRERERERESAGFQRLCRESGWEFWESAGSRGLLLGWRFGEECRVLWVEIFLVLVFVVGYC